MCLKECATLSAMHLHLPTMRWKQTWRLPISLCTTICPATVTHCSAVLDLLHLQQIELETTLFIKTEHLEKAAYSWRLTEAWVCWPQSIVEHREAPLESQVKIPVLKGDICLRIFFLWCFGFQISWNINRNSLLIFNVSSSEISVDWLRWSWKSTGSNADLFV